jgi:hypothetical protein
VLVISERGSARVRLSRIQLLHTNKILDTSTI